MLRKAGLKRADIIVVPLTADQQADAWKQGAIDAVACYEPAASQIIAMGGQNLFDSRQIPDLIMDVLAVRDSVLDDVHSESIRHLVAAHLRGLNYILSNSDDASYRIAPHLKLPHEEVLSEFRGLVLPDLDNNIRLLKTNEPPVLKSAENMSNILLEAGILSKKADLSNLLRPEYLPRQDEDFQLSGWPP